MIRSHHPLTRHAWMLAIAAGALLVGCNRTDDTRTSGQALDGPIADAQQPPADQTTGPTTAPDSSAQTDTSPTMGERAEQMADAVGDSAVTAAIHAKLAQDGDLRSLDINVDTKSGHVTLNGTAPSDAAKERATTLAKGTDGVVTVTNLLEVRQN